MKRIGGPTLFRVAIGMRGVLLMTALPRRHLVILSVRLSRRPMLYILNSHAEKYTQGVGLLLGSREYQALVTWH